MFGCLVCLTSLFGCFTFILHLFVALLCCFPIVWLAFSIFPPLSGSPRFPYGLSPSFPALPAGCAGYPGAVFHVGGEALYSPCLCPRVSLFRPPRSPRSTRFTPLRAPSLPSSSTRHCCSPPPCWPTCWRVPAGRLVPTTLRHPRALLRNRHAWSSPLPPQPPLPCPPPSPQPKRAAPTAGPPSSRFRLYAPAVCFLSLAVHRGGECCWLHTPTMVVPPLCRRLVMVDAPSRRRMLRDRSRGGPLHRVAGPPHPAVGPGGGGGMRLHRARWMWTALHAS